MTLKGIGASRGIAIAKVFELKKYDVNIQKNQITNIDDEIKKFTSAVELAIKQIEKLKDNASSNLDEEHLVILDAHIEIAKDPVFSSDICDLIKSEKVCAEYATDVVAKRNIEIFENIDDEYLKERVADIKDVSQRIIFNILGIQKEDLTLINEEVIIVADDLTPSETSQLNKKYIKGFATNIGGRTSHSAIMARSLEIPAVLGIGDITEKVNTGDILAINGTTGEVYINPSQDIINKLNDEIKHLEELKILYAKFKNKPSVTKDGKQVEISSNIGSPNDINGVIESTSDGIGLFRSEFLYMDSSNWPSEEKQYEAYKAVIEKMGGKKTIIRTLDIGGDKKLKYFNFPEEMNPFLGYRAIRFCLDNKEIFDTQLRALIRASEFGRLGIMFPMISNINEFKQAKERFNQVYNEVKKEYPNVSDQIEVGMMVEIPSAAVNCDKFCKYADFVSIGTNDLVQYSMAADRMSEKISYLYQPMNPSLLKLIKMTIDGAHKNGKWVGMCGEMAGHAQAVPILLGLGLDEFSMSSTSVLRTRELMSRINFKEAQELANQCLDLETEEEVIKLVESKQWN